MRISPAIAIMFGVFVFAWAASSHPAPPPQMSDICADNQLVAADVTNKRYKCISATLVYRVKNVNLNAGANTDSGSSFTGLPSRYIVRRLTFENASGGGGTAIVTAQALSTLNASTVLVDSTLAVTSTVQTASTLFLRNVAAAGAPMTADCALEITPLL